MPDSVSLKLKCVRTDELTFSRRIYLKIVVDDSNFEEVELPGRMTFDVPDDVQLPFEFQKGLAYSAEIKADA